MVERQLRRRGIRDERVLAAMLEIPREEFVPPESRVSCLRRLAAAHRPRPDHLAALHDGADGGVARIDGHETVLEVGAGSRIRGGGAGRARGAGGFDRDCSRPGRSGARESARAPAATATSTVVCGDGSMGYPEMAPYDAISVAAGAPEIPAGAAGAIARPRPPGDSGGRVATTRSCACWSSSGGRMSDRVATVCQFVPLRGSDGWR